MTKDVLEEKLERMIADRERLERRLGVDVRTLTQDEDKSLIIERLMANLVEGMLNLAGAIVMEAGSRPFGRGGVIEAMARQKHLSAEEAAELRQLLDLRNRLIHDYLDVSPVQLHRSLDPAVRIAQILERVAQRILGQKS